MSSKEADANASLIAAAPDMLAALTGLLGMRAGALGATYSDRIEAARAAIAKATGATNG